MTNRLCIKSVNNHLVVFDLSRIVRIYPNNPTSVAGCTLNITVVCSEQEAIILTVTEAEWLRIIKRMEEL